MIKFQWSKSQKPEEKKEEKKSQKYCNFRFAFAPTTAAVAVNTAPFFPPNAASHCLKIPQNVAFEFWHFPPIFVLLKLTCLVTLFDRKL